MCIRSAQSIISGKQYPLLSRVLNSQRIDRNPDRLLVSTYASAAPRGQLQIQGSTRICAPQAFYSFWGIHYLLWPWEQFKKNTCKRRGHLHWLNSARRAFRKNKWPKEIKNRRIEKHFRQFDNTRAAQQIHSKSKHHHQIQKGTRADCRSVVLENEVMI